MKLAKNLIQVSGKAKKRWRLAFVAAVFLACICLIPVPFRQFAAGWVQPESMRGVYAPASGILDDNQHMPASGSLVRKNTALFSIHDMVAIQDVIRAEGMRDLAQVEFDFNKFAQSKKVDSSETALINVEDRLREAQAELEKRTLRAPCDGQFLVMPATPPTGQWNLETGSLKYNWDSPTQSGRLIPSGAMLATICSSQMTAIIPLSDSQLEWIASGTEVRLRCVERTAEVYTCKVDKVVPLEDVSATWRLMNGELTEVAANSSSASIGRNGGSAVYAAQIRLPAVVRGSVGARIDGVLVAPSQTVTSLFCRWLQQNLRWLAD